MGPNYRRPPVSVPDAFRAPEPPQAGAAPDAASLGDVRWWEVFRDPELQRLLRTALDRNYDIRIAATRIEQAAANVGIVRADQFPELGATAGYNRTKSSGAAVPFLPGFAGVTNTILSITPRVSWAVDFWGQYRRETEAARAELLATEAGREAVRVSIVAAVGSAYFQLRELDLELGITNRTLATRRDSLRLTRIREQGGVASLVDVRQAESLVTTATATIPQIQQQIQQTENLIATLLGGNPGPVARGLPLDQQTIPQVPPGLPSALLTRRPDIRAAEQVLIAANARIGVARAAWFPNIVLSSYSGLQTASLGDAVTKRSWVWGFTPSLDVPIFTAGRIRSGIALTEAQQREAVLVYQQTIQQALQDVSDSLIALTRTREFRIQQEALTATYRDAARLSDVRYRGGVTTYLEVLDSERNVYAAELNLARAQLNELTSVVQLYSALGGGWQQ
jgi:multidrug efflux system outer membrane protein